MQWSTQDIEQYLREILHAPVRMEPWHNAAGLPNYLAGRYRFFAGEVGGTRILFMQTDEEVTPSIAAKHEHALLQQWDGPVAFVLGAITARSRQRLVGQGVAFVVPRTQVYLPALGINLTERYKERTVGAERLRPSAQLLLLQVLAGHGSGVNTPGVAADLLGYTAVAMGQALDQLELAELVRVRKAGRRRTFELAGGPAEIWARAQPVLASPVRRRHYIAGANRRADAMLAAGLSALAEYSALAGPRVPTVAASSAHAKRLLASQDVNELPSADEADIQVEVWSYTPELLAIERHTVDRLSLFLSLRDDPDERVQSALEEMMRGLQW